MILASLKQGGRDGTLVVVDSTRTRLRPVPQIAATLQAALDCWSEAAPELQAACADLNREPAQSSEPLDPAALACPLPRSYQFLDGSVYLHHMEKARRARGADMPPNYRTEPLMYQGVSDGFCAPGEPMRLPSEDLEIDYEAEIAVVLDDVPLGISAAAAGKHVKLLLLMNDYTARALTRSEIPKGFGFVQAKPTSSFAPFAVSPDELPSWDGTRLSARVETRVNGKLLGAPDAGTDMFFTYPQLIAHAARTRSLCAGTIIAAGAISNQDPTLGHGCIAEARTDEQTSTGTAQTPWLRFGDLIRIEAFDSAGVSLFGAIEQRIEQSPPA